MFGQYKYFTYKMASNYIYKEKTFQGWIMGVKRKIFIYNYKETDTHTRIHTHTDTEEKIWS